MVNTGNLLCGVCGGRMKLQKLSQSFIYKSKEYAFDGIEVYVCVECHEMEYPGSVVESIDRRIAALTAHKEE